MPTNPTRSDVHVSAPLTNISVAYMNRAEDFVAPHVFPVVPVLKQADRYFVYDLGDWRRSEAQVRAPSTESAGAGWKLDNTPNYYCDVIALHKDIDDGVRANADSVINMDRDATEYVSQMLMLKREIDWATSFFATSTWTGSSTGSDITPGTLWSAGSSTPVADVEAQKVAVHEKTGKMPNILVVGADVHTALKSNEDILGRIKYTQKGVVTNELLASLFEVDKYMVARATKTTSAEGSASDTFDHIANAKDALLCYSEPNPGILKPSAGYTFSWTGYLGAGPQGQRMNKFRMDQIRSDRVEGEMAYDMKQIGATLGAYFDGAVT